MLRSDQRGRERKRDGNPNVTIIPDLESFSERVKGDLVIFLNGIKCSERIKEGSN